MSGYKITVKLRFPNSSPEKVVLSPSKKRKKQKHEKKGHHHHHHHHKKVKKHGEEKKHHSHNVVETTNTSILKDSRTLSSHQFSSQAEGEKVQEVNSKEAISTPVEKEKPKTPNYADMQRVIGHLQKQDKWDIFKEPVTDEVAPGYSSIVSNPMDFSTIRAKFGKGEYTSWERLLDDMMLMFDNSMLYNPPDTLYYKQSKTLKEVAKKLVELGQRGVRNFRGKTAGVVRAHNAQVAADERAEKNQVKAAIRAQRLQMKNDKLLQKAAASGILLPSTATVPNLRNSSTWSYNPHGPQFDGRRPLLAEENTRLSYNALLSPKSPAFPWGGLIGGANGDGVAFAGAQLRMVPLHGGVTHAMYNKSVNSFLEKLEGRAKEYALRKLNW